MTDRYRRPDDRADQTLQLVADSIVAWRKLHQLPQEDLARRAGISRPVLTRLERGEPGVGIGALVRVLGVLGLDDDLTQALDPYRTQFAHHLAARTQVQRVRRPTGRRRQA